MMDDRILIANEGMTYTNGYVYWKKVYLGVNDSPENWHQITDAEAEQRQNEEADADIIK